MRRLLMRLCHLGAWCCLVLALPLIWLAGFCRGVAVSLEGVPVEAGPSHLGRSGTPVILTDTDMAVLMGAHESALRRGEARWQ